MLLGKRGLPSKATSVSARAVLPRSFILTSLINLMCTQCVLVFTCYVCVCERERGERECVYERERVQISEILIWMPWTCTSPHWKGLWPYINKTLSVSVYTFCGIVVVVCSPAEHYGGHPVHAVVPWQIHSNGWYDCGSGIWYSGHSGKNWMGCVWEGWGGLGGMELWVGSNAMKLFSFLYIAASRMAHVHHFSCLYTLLLVIHVLISWTCCLQ